MSRNRRRLSVQSLETRKMMAADTFGSGGGILNDGGTAMVGQATDKEIIDALNNGTQLTNADATDQVMAKWVASQKGFLEFTFVDM